jgi:hypothetical protein
MSVKKRDPLFVVVVSFITAYIYGLYWFYHTRKEINELSGVKRDPLIWTLALFIPFVNLYSIWKYCEDLKAATKMERDPLVLFIAWIVFIPIAQYLVQEELNKFAK